MRRVLEHYFRVVEKQEKPKFQIARENGILDEKIEKAEELVEDCCFCEQRCGVNRKKGELGNCGVGYESRVSSAFIHMGEEPQIIPSGTIFFSGCNFHCVYCQNYDISQQPMSGEVWTPEEIAIWIERNKTRIRNVNFVGGEPTPNLHNILKALKVCKAQVPVVWNSNMYMSSEVMNLLEGVVDLYLADFKYENSECAKKLSNVQNYFKVVSRNYESAIEHADILIRQLVLPNHVECCSKPILRWVKENLDDRPLINIMSQYRPSYTANEHTEIDRFLRNEEYSNVVNYAKELGLKNLEIQGMSLIYI